MRCVCILCFAQAYTIGDDNVELPFKPFATRRNALLHPEAMAKYEIA